MKPKTFQEYLSRYGADLKRWPEAVRQEASEILQQDREYQKWQEEEQKFEEVLRSVTVKPPAEDLARRIVARAAGLAQEIPSVLGRTNWGDWIRDLFRPRVATAFACLLVLGVFLGFLARGQLQTTEQATDLAKLFNNEEMIWTTGSNTSY